MCAYIQCLAMLGARRLMQCSSSSHTHLFVLCGEGECVENDELAVGYQTLLSLLRGGLGSHGPPGVKVALVQGIHLDTRTPAQTQTVGTYTDTSGRILASNTGLQQDKAHTHKQNQIPN